MRLGWPGFLLVSLVLAGGARAGEGGASWQLALTGGGVALTTGTAIGVGLEVGGSGGSLMAAAILAAGGSTSYEMLAQGVRKEWIVRAKVDHDIHVAGGESTPFLLELYRQLRARAQGGEGAWLLEGQEIDEERLSATLERMAAWAQASGIP